MNPLSISTPRPEARPAVKPYHLTEEQVRSFDENGYLVLRNWIPKELLKRLQDAADRWIDKGLETYRDLGVEAADKLDYRFANRPGGKHAFWRIDFLHDKGEDASLELLGSPFVLGVAESLNGPNFFPTYESMVFKFPGDGEAVRWHQDAVQKRNYRVWNYDLYLDKSKADNGALRVLPKSHLKKQDACEFEAEHGWVHPDIITVEMEPGDVLLHDVMVYHGSPRTSGGDLRRTIYYEFRSVEWNRDSGIWANEWIDRRLKLIPQTIEKYTAAFPGWMQFDWNIDPQWRPTEYASAEKDLRIVHETDVQGSYCSATSPASV